MTGATEGIFRSCNVCGQDQWTAWMRPAHSPGPLVRCRNCGFVWVNPLEDSASVIMNGPVLGNQPAEHLTSANPDDVQDKWELFNIQEELRKAPLARENARLALGEIDRLVQGNRGRLLDIGSFCGTFLSVAQEQGWQCSGIEPLVGPSIFARQRNGVEIITDTLHEDSFPPDSFNVITAFQVFEHLMNPAREMSLAYHLLKPGGLLLVEVPNIDTPWIRLLGGRHRHFVEDHISFFNVRTLSQLMQCNGFCVRRVYYPTRSVSLHHLMWRGGRYYPRLEQLARRMIPLALQDKPLHINLGDIVAVIGEKVSQQAVCAPERNTGQST